MTRNRHTHWWDYRIVLRKDAAGHQYALHEAYYNKNGCWAISTDAVGVYGETVMDLHRSYLRLADAFGRPVLDYNTRREVEQ